MSWSLIFSAISIVFYYIICKGFIYESDYKRKKPFTLLHFLLLSLVSLVPILNIIEFCAVTIFLVAAICNDYIHIKNPNNKITKFLNKEL